MSSKKRPFVIDCDTGTDDAIAIIASYGCEDMEVCAITSVNGNVSEKYVAQNNLDLVEYLGKDTPVAKGAVKPIRPSGNHSVDMTHGKTGLGTIVLPHALRHTFDSRIASQVIYEEAVKHHGELELLVTGPMTNVAAALCLHRDLPSLIHHIWFMGGSVIGGNVTTTSEFNIWVDPEAAHDVFMSGIPLTMVGLDVTLKAIMKREDVERLRKTDTHAASLAADLLDFMFERHAKGGEDVIMHDALALGAAMHPECLKCGEYFGDVECSGTYTRGHTAIDLRGRRKQKPNVSAALEIDVDDFRNWLISRIEKAMV